MSPVKIIALTEAGILLAQRLQKIVTSQGAECQILFKPKPFAETVQRAYQQGERLIAICATGIIIRTLAPVLTDKYRDPAVLAVDEAGQFVIPLLSGHEGGANDWGHKIAMKLGATWVSTTANNYISPQYTLGLGCERNCPAEYLESLIHDCLKQADITIDQVHSFNSIDLKADERAMITIAQKYQRPFSTWTVADLNTVSARLKNPSQYVFDTVGVAGVAESSALLAGDRLAASSAELLVGKQKNAKATCAIARVYPNKQPEIKSSL